MVLVCAILSHSFCFYASLSLSPNLSLSSLDISISFVASKQASKQAASVDLVVSSRALFFQLEDPVCSCCKHL
ncbi:hypothetical protein CY35_11G039000 [Sphagnum magellanicum]|nr:hypothetical protein CY35_11G039000 [Sphagnum magellanicum]